MKTTLTNQIDDTNNTDKKIKMPKKLQNRLSMNLTETIKKNKTKED
jgi:hypothetical protein